jgi:hydroxymethylbilane synthase
MARSLRLGTRNSKLALIQSESVASRLRSLGVEITLVPVRVDSDTLPPSSTLGEGIFVSALEQALLEDTVDLAVHSAKDLPLIEREGLTLAAYPERSDPRDALITAAGGMTLKTLPWGSTLGTDSPRRGAFAICERPDLNVVPLRGNVDTRLRKLDQGEVGALILAAAGLERLGCAGRIDCRLEPSVMPPAPAQGALAVQTRAGDNETVELVRKLDQPEVRLAVETERQLLSAMGGSCRSPVGGLARVDCRRLRLLAGVAGPTGRHLLTLEAEVAAAASQRLAAAAGRELRSYLIPEAASIRSTR